MNSDDRERKWKATSKVHIEVNNDADISNLNDDESFLPIEEEEKVPLTEEEKKAVRKKLFFLLIIIIIVLIGLLVVLIFNPFQSNDELTTDQTEEKENQEKEEEKAISTLEDGVISSTNNELQTLIEEIVNHPKDYYENDTLALYRTDSTNINDLTDKDKLFLVSKTNDFDSLIKNKANSDAICNTNIVIEKTSIDDILDKRLNTTITNYETFTYNIYEEDDYVKTIQFTYQDNSYIGQCHVLDENLINLSQQAVISATKENKQLYIDVKVVFISQSGVYKDPNFTTLITNQNQSFEEYITYGNTYRYTYDISSSSYSLINVSLLK